MVCPRSMEKWNRELETFSPKLQGSWNGIFVFLDQLFNMDMISQLEKSWGLYFTLNTDFCVSTISFTINKWVPLEELHFLKILDNIKVETSNEKQTEINKNRSKEGIMTNTIISVLISHFL